MLKEFSIPSFFSSSRTHIIKASGIREVSQGKKVLVFALVVLNSILLFAYIAGVNNYASTGYEIKGMQNKISQLNQENKKLTLAVSEKASVSNLQSELSQSGYRVVKQAKFLQGSGQYSQK